MTQKVHTVSEGTDMSLAFTIQEVAAAARVSRTEIYRAMGRGELKAKKLGRRTVILHDDLMTYFASLPDYATAA